MNKIKILGVIIDENLSWEPQTKQVKGRAVNVVKHLARTSRVLPQRSRRMLYDALVCPHLSYGDVVWDGCGKKQQADLQRVHNFASKIILGAERRTPSREVLKAVGMVPLVEKRKIHQAVFLHKLVNGRGSAELCERLQEVHDKKGSMTEAKEGLRSTKTLLIPPKQHRTTKYENSTLWRATKAWNSTGNHLKLIDDTSKFKVEVQREVWRTYHGC